MEEFNVGPEVYEDRKIFNWTEQEFLRNNGDFEPRNNTFATALCSSERCSNHGGKDEWVLSRDSPCKDSLHTTGVLCGICKKGYRWSFGALVSDASRNHQHGLYNAKMLSTPPPPPPSPS